jgi:hypothetical protein
MTERAKRSPTAIELREALRIGEAFLGGDTRFRVCLVRSRRLYNYGDVVLGYAHVEWEPPPHAMSNVNLSFHWLSGIVTSQREMAGLWADAIIIPMRLCETTALSVSLWTSAFDHRDGTRLPPLVDMRPVG